MSISEIRNKVILAGAKGYGLTIGEPTTQWWSAAITPGTSKAFGSWVQLVASTSEDILLWYIHVEPPFYAGGVRSVVSIGTGAAASEVEVLQLPVRHTSYGLWYFSLPVPILIPSGTRIAARMAMDDVNAQANGYVTLGHIKASVISSY